MFEQLPTVALAMLIGKEKNTILRTLDDLSSVIYHREHDPLPIRLLHHSFRDYLLDKKRCKARKWEYFRGEVGAGFIPPNPLFALVRSSSFAGHDG
jgi:hypothetical protein